MDAMFFKVDKQSVIISLFLISAFTHHLLSFPFPAAYAVIANGQVECPKGYKRMNMTHCQGKGKERCLVV